ncbi:nucleoside-binding protein [Halanaerobium saccharolyticum]|uniref:Nucleoside-binding protein n=1 Tax=Halanaerobium saccharolyticum TaxID=43595 RepID=A0A4R7YPE7_9FIRM|nr:BMP family ABC transporter substrate-binding protein [Halanaerobium saccharolyticum]RAK05111.1 nucleoside-binding protein [Halanaerobium saccharolyticum]TDV98878.1 nucleoside-binding protein [Halanaerobium saccharolyticum]TDX51580.1 nucleoside-binding protein [Halanaerobium saccharolyticum]
MSYKKLSIILLLLLIFSFSASAQYLEVALVSDIGGFEDNSYNEQLRESLNNVNQNFNLKLEFRESELMTDYQENINHFAENNFDLIWGTGFTMEQAVKEAAQMYPEINFVIFDGIVEEENVMSLTFREEEAAFLAGIIAALKTESSTVAFIGGRETEKIRNFERGFNTGVEVVNSEIEVINRYLGSFNDFSTAKEISGELVSQNVDLIFYAAGAASKGIIDTALEQNINLISLDAGDIDLAPNNILTVIQKNTDYLVEQVIESYYNDNYVNEIKEYGLVDNAFLLEENQAEDRLSQEILNKVEEYKQQFLAGEIEIRQSNQ